MTNLSKDCLYRLSQGLELFTLTAIYTIPARSTPRFYIDVSMVTTDTYMFSALYILKKISITHLAHVMIDGNHPLCFSVGHYELATSMRISA